MGLLDKTNPKATWQSVILWAVYGALAVPAFFFLLGKPAIREHWPITLPLFAILGASVSAIYEWQVAADCGCEPDEDSRESDSGAQE